MVRLPAWPWRRPETAADYASAVVPLEEAHQHGHSYRLGRRPSRVVGQLDDDASDEEDHSAGAGDGRDKDGDDGDDDTGMLLTNSAAAEYSIEGLRREVRRGERGRKWTAYESKFIWVPVSAWLY